MIRFVLGLGAIIAGVGLIEGSSSFAIGIPVIVVGVLVILWALTSAQLTEYVIYAKQSTSAIS